MEKDEIIKTFVSGQKEVALVKNEKYGVCIRKTKKENTSTSRIVREIEIQNKFNCEYYPKIYFSDINPDKLLIYEEYIQGKDLSCIFKSDNYYKNNEGECINLLKHLLLGLNYIWNESIVHRDLKPQNIIIKDDKKPVMLDLGIAKILDGNDSTTLWFTAGYAPIEQFSGKTGQIDKRTDFFSIGVIIYEMFFGERLFRNNDEVINKEPKFDLDGFSVSEEFRSILNKMLGKRIFERYRKVDDILADINAIQKGESDEKNKNISSMWI